MVDTYSPGGPLRLVHNPHWDQATDPVRHRLVEAIEVTPKVEAGELDEKLLSGAADLDLGGTGLTAPASPGSQSNPNLRKNVDNPLTGFTSFVAINTAQAPLDDLHCRRAVILAADHEALLAAYGGSSSGDLATTLLPPTVSGHRDADRYGILTPAPATSPRPRRSSRRAASRPASAPGSRSARTGRRRSRARRRSPWRSTGSAIKLDIAQFPADRYFADFAGNPRTPGRTTSACRSPRGRATGRPGYAFLAKLVDSRAIRESSNSNLSQLHDPRSTDCSTRGAKSPDPAARIEAWGAVDAEVMDDAAVLPLVFERVLSYRSSELTNVFVHQRYGMYDVAMLGLNPPPEKPDAP